MEWYGTVWNGNGNGTKKWNEAEWSGTELLFITNPNLFHLFPSFPFCFRSRFKQFHFLFIIDIEILISIFTILFIV